MDEEGLGSPPIRIFLEGNCELAWHHRATSKNEIPLQSGKDPPEHCSIAEKKNAKEVRLRSTGCNICCGGQSEATLNAKGYSVADERRILDVLGRGLRKEFPNPERIGCPGAEVLKKIAYRKMPLSEAEAWLDHLGSCSPCYNDFSRFREASQRDRSRTLLAVAASILLVATVAGWASLRHRNDNLPAQTAILDLRNRSIARGAETNPEEPP